MVSCEYEGRGICVDGSLEKIFFQVAHEQLIRYMRKIITCIVSKIIVGFHWDESLDTVQW